MSDDKLDLILSKLSMIEATQRSQGEHIEQLIHIVGATNARLEELVEEVETVKEDLAAVKEDLAAVKEDLADTRETLHLFRSETNVNFKKMDRRVKLVETNLDETMVKVEAMTVSKD